MALDSIIPDTLAPGTRPAQVDVWIIDLNSPGLVAAAANLLPPEEQTRANAFQNEAACRRYVLTRAALRMLLAGRLQVAPSAITFRNGPHGKPEMAGGFAGRLPFNLTHSAGLALVAISPDGEVGIDVEKIRLLPNARRIAERFFTPTESAALNALPEAEATPAFFDLWTRKEALAKSTGQGIMHSLARFELSLLTGFALKAVEGNPANSAPWCLKGFTPAPGYVAAIAVQRPFAQITIHKFEVGPGKNSIMQHTARDSIHA